jgi:hypothetical protein
VTDQPDPGLPAELEPYVARIRRIGAKVLRDAERLQRLESEALTDEELECILTGLTDLKLRFIQGPARRDWTTHDAVVTRLTAMQRGRA